MASAQSSFMWLMPWNKPHYSISYKANFDHLFNGNKVSNKPTATTKLTQCKTLFQMACKEGQFDVVDLIKSRFLVSIWMLKMWMEWLILNWKIGKNSCTVIRYSRTELVLQVQVHCCEFLDVKVFDGLWTNRSHFLNQPVCLLLLLGSTQIEQFQIRSPCR